MKIEVTKELISRYENSEHITDDECKALYKFYLELSEKIHLLGPTFQLAYMPLKVMADRFNGYMIASSERKRK